jgi:hypothetical protein
MTSGSWTITHDPLGLLSEKTDARKLEADAREQGEDILHAVRGRMTLDLGWYRDCYAILLIEDRNWEKPVRQAEATDLVAALEALRQFLA